MKLRKNEVVLFQGDSITDGNRGRNEDPNHLLGHGYQYIIGAKMLLDNIDNNIKVYNRGVSGNRIADLYGRWLEDTISLKPTLLSVLIGINDGLFGFYSKTGSSPERFERIYHMLLDEALERCNDMRIVIMEPFCGKNFAGDDIRESVCGYIRSIQPVCRRVAEEYDAVYVPLQDIFDRYFESYDHRDFIWDGVHPTIMGQEIIARQWIKCVCEKYREYQDV